MAAASGLNMAEGKSFWEENRVEMKKKINSLCEVFVELDLPVGRISFHCYSLANLACQVAF